MHKRLKVVAKSSPSSSKKALFEQKARQTYAAFWKEEKNKAPSFFEKRRKERIAHFLSAEIKEGIGKKAVDIGCGDGHAAERLLKAGYEVQALDVAPNAYCKAHYACFPYLDVPEGHFDVVLCLDVIAELPKELYRLALSELAYVIKPDGVLVASTPLDTKSLDACEQFLALLSTEFCLKKMYKTHDRLALFFNKVFPFFTPSPSLLRVLEKISCLLWGDRGVTHILCQAKRRNPFGNF